MTASRGLRTSQPFSATTVANGGGTATSSAFTGIAGGDSMSLFLLVTGANGNVKIEILTSRDTTTYTAPETGSLIITGITDQLQHHAVIQIPVCSGYKLKATNSGAGDVTVDAYVLSL